MPSALPLLMHLHAIQKGSCAAISHVTPREVGVGSTRMLLGCSRFLMAEYAFNQTKWSGPGAGCTEH